MDDISEKEKEMKLKESEDSSTDSNASEGGSRTAPTDKKHEESTTSITNEGSDQNKEPDVMPELGDEYEIIEFIGKGGMGAVYKVKDKSLDKILAVKVLQKELADDAAALKRFEQESDAASKLSHPNLVSVYKHGKTQNGEPFLVMDYLEGKSLSDLIDDKKNLNADKVLDIFIQVCDALEHAHKNHVLHRDIKPTNIILVENEDGKEVAKIVDFGIAKVMNATTRETHDLTQTGEVFGSPHYMSPEQCLGFMLKEHSDIYSLGCSLYEAITGSPPFGGSNPIQLVVKHINDPVDRFDREFKTNKKLKQLETVTLKCLEKEPGDRFQTVTDLKTDLEKIKEGKSIPLYAVKTKAKPTLTKRQVLVIGALIIGAMVYITMASQWTPSNIGSQISMGVATLIFGASFTALTLVGVDKLKGVLSDKRSAQNWWLMLLSLLGGVAGLVMIPNMLVSVIFYTSYNAPLLAQQISSIFTVLHVPIMILVTAAGIGYLTFRKAKDVGARYIFTRYALILALLIAVPIATIPEQVSKITGHLANTTAVTFPKASMLFEYWRSLLQYEPSDSMKSLAQLLYKNDQKKEAYKTLEKAVKEIKNKKELNSIFRLQSEFYAKDKMYEKAIALLNKSAEGDIDKYTGEPSNDHLITRADYYFQLGMKAKAIADLDKYISTHAGNSTAFDDKAKILASQKKYREAINVLDHALTTHSSSAARHLLKGILEEKIGNTELAGKEFKKVLDHEKWVQDNDRYSEYIFEALYIAYAQYKLGNIDKTNYILDQVREKKITKDKLAEILKMDKSDLDW